MSTSAKTWLVFKSGTDSYAIESSAIQEIVRNNEIFPLPFVPKYITGVLNYYGNPYAVLDFSQYLNGDPLNSKLFIILNNANNVALQIDDIQEFHSENEITEVKLTNQAENQNFIGAIAFDDITAPIVNLDGIFEKVQVDLESK